MRTPSAAGGTHIVISIYDDLPNPHYGGGGAVVAAEIARALSTGHRVTVLSGSYRGSVRHRAGGIDHEYLPVGWAGPRGGQLLFHGLLPVVAAFKRYDLWIESFTPPHSTSFLPLFARGRPVVGLVQMLAGAEMARKYRLPFAAVERWGLGRYRRFIVLNQVDERIVAEQNRRAVVSLVPNGIRLNADQPEPTYGSGDHILYLGRIDVDQKGLDLLLEAYRKADTALPLLIAGAGTAKEEKRLRSLVGANDSRIRLLGHQSGAAKAALLAGCAFLVMPSRYETFGMSALEAMAHGKPVVVFDLPRTGWITPESGLRVPPFDVPALADAVHRLATQPELRATLGRGARAYARRATWDAAGDRYRAIVDDVLAAGRGR